MNTYLLNVTDTENLNGGRYPAYEVLKYRLGHSVWGLNKNTRFNSSISAGDRLLFYVAGNLVGHGCIVAQAYVKGIIPFEETFVKDYYDESKHYSDTPSKLLKLEKVKYFDKPFNMRDNLAKLSFFKGNWEKWGCYMQGGVKRLNESDYNVVKELI